jgi:hypothetical protein
MSAFLRHISIMHLLSRDLAPAAAASAFAGWGEGP